MAKKLYKKIGKWKGFDNFGCILCEYATINEQAMKQHIGGHFESPKNVNEEEDKEK